MHWTADPASPPGTDAAALRRIPLFDGLDDAQLRELVAMGTEQPFAPGDELFLEGRPADFWWVLLEGCVDLVRHVGREEMLLGSMDVPGRWAGGFRAWDADGAYLATGRARSPGRVLRVPAPALRTWSSTYYPFGDHLAEGLFRTVRRFESLTRQRESLIALGTLAAGLAHEINNPAAAATRAVDALGDASDRMLAALGRLAECGLTADRFTALDELRRQVGPIRPATDPMARADLERDLVAWLEDHGIGQPWSLAAVLAGAGVDAGWCERAADVLGERALEPGLAWVSATLSSGASLAAVKESTRRISDLVAAVASYSQLDRATMQRTDVAEGLTSTLVMLAHRIPAGIEVVRDTAPDVPVIEAAPAELNQVWTHLVDNALEAMDGRGTLRVSVRPDVSGGVLVEIGDTGRGMSAEVQRHAFDPFFTTKSVGQGSGLGLDVARRIVDRHGGDIAIDARPGETVLRVRLPAGTTTANG